MPIMIVGNKCDEENNREVKKELASKLVAESMKDSGHMETSAKLDLNVQQAFQVSIFALDIANKQTNKPSRANPNKQTNKQTRNYCRLTKRGSCR